MARGDRLEVVNFGVERDPDVDLRFLVCFH